MFSKRTTLLLSLLRFAGVMLPALCLSAGLFTIGRTQQTGGLTQRRINTLAAALQKTHRALIEDAGLRQPNEPFEAYFARIAVPLPGETSARHARRIQGYLSALEQAAQASAAFRTVPALQDTGPENQRHWQDTAHPLSSLPGRIVKTQAAWQREQSSKSPPSASHSPTGATQGSGRLGAELALTMRLINSASEALRDARP